MLSGGTGALTGTIGDSSFGTTPLGMFFQEVRNLISIGLTSDDLSDSILNSMIYFKASELNLIRLLGYEDDPEPYETKLTSDDDFKDRAEVWIATRMAASILPALGQILEEGILNERVRYQELDLQERINLLLGIGDDAITPDLSDPSTEGAIFAKACRYVAY